MKNINIRSYLATDAPVIEQLAVAFHEFLIPLDPLHRLRVTPNYGKKYLKICLSEVTKQNGAFLIATKGQEIAGFIIGVIVTQTPEELMGHKLDIFGRITELYVQEKYRQLGVGKKLIQKIEEYFQKQKCDFVMVEVFVPNKNAHQFYHAVGFHDRSTDLIKKL